MPEGACNAKICPCASNICQLRLDFLTFNIAQPSLEAVAAVSKLLNGAVVSGAGKDVTNMGQCLTDTFTVTSPGGIAPPTICGQNDGQHSKYINRVSQQVLDRNLAKKSSNVTKGEKKL